MSAGVHAQTKVLIIQPVVPVYRMPFFRGLIQSGRFDYTIHAGSHINWGPVSCSAAGEFADLSHETLALFGGRIFWQQNLWIPERFGAGDILVLSGSPRLLNNPFLIIQARLKNMKIAWWGQGWTAGLKPWKLLFRRQLMKLVDVVMLYTEKEARDYVAAGFERMRVFGLNNTIGTAEILLRSKQWNVSRMEEFKQRQNFTRPHRILFVGRLMQKARLNLAIDALRHLPENLYELLIIGNGPELGALQDTARVHGVEHRIRWLGEIYEEDILAPYFLTSSCFVYPGGIGLSLLHAMAYGLPVITHDNARDHMPEFAALVDGINGLTFEQENPRSLADKIEALCSDVTLSQSLRDGSLQRIRNDYSMEHMVETFEKALLRAAYL